MKVVHDRIVLNSLKQNIFITLCVRFHSKDFLVFLFVAKGDKEGKWKWTQVKQSGIRPSLRCGFSLATGPGNKAYLFGGVYDEETSDETLKGHFYNDLYMLDTDKTKKTRRKWKERTKKGKNRKDDDTDVEQGSGKWEELDLECSGNGKTQEKMDIVHETDDGIFTVKIGPQTLSTEMNLCDVTASSKKLSESFVPWPRMNAGMVIKHKTLYVYGGLYEDGDRQLTLSDFHSLDLHKLDEWHTLIELDTKSQQWLESESDDDDEEVEDEGMEDAGAAGEPKREMTPAILRKSKEHRMYSLEK
ncbi:kelch domain-containing protein 4-like [Tachypleus tridentatus]|uniref:kelch domain-containing protein 4-like n=1 Tax=Tachypleus tridentatus TaxID=6853 RepID=UPI003FD54892